jgi:hypothetical protein
MTETPGNLKPHQDHILARAIATALVIAAVYGVCNLLAYNVTGSFWPFMALVVGGSFLGNLIGYSVGQKMAAK